VDAHKFLPELKSLEYPAGALAAAVYLTSGIRTMERGTISMDRAQDGTELASDLELVRFAVPRRVYTMSHVEYSVDRIKWLYDHRHLIGGLKFTEEPPVLRFFLGKLEPIDNWGARLVEAFRADFGPDC
jgi:tryptophanase